MGKKTLKGNYSDSITYEPEGKTLLSVEHVGDDIVMTFEDAKVVLACEGDCCAHAFFTDLDASSSLPAILTSWEDESGESGGLEYGDVLDISFVKIKTSKGRIDFSLHVDHNGYYGGWYYLSSVTPT